MRHGWVAALVFGACAAQAAEPVKIGITTILSGPTYDRGQTEQYGAQLALNEINAAGGVLGRQVQAYYADNACKPPIGVPAVQRLLDEQKVPVVIGALCTPVTHAIMPVMQQAKVPLIIATSAGQDFVDASGVGGNAYSFKTIPSEVDIARGLMRYLKAQKVASVAILNDAGGFPEANAKAMAQAAQDNGIKVTGQEKIPQGTTDFGAELGKVKDGSPDRLVMILGPSTGGVMKAYEASGWNVPLTGRVDPAMAMKAVSPDFVAKGGLAQMTSVAVFSPVQDTPGVKAFVASYEAHYQTVPNQRPFFVYEATKLAADAIRRAHSDKPEAVEAALKTTTMKSALGGTYKFDDHNHSHTPILIVGFKDGKPAVVATESSLP
jgi:branched-chain amino acid transport system substrate-binding protein